MKAINFTAFRNRSYWLWIPALYCLSRLILLFYSPHSIYRFEELYQGYLGIEFLDGRLQGSIFDYQIDPYTGGSLVVGALAAVSFKLFGANLFALKLVPFLFSLATLLVSMGFLQRFFGKDAVIGGGLLLSFPAPALASLSLSALGSHPEARLFAICAIWLFYEVLFCQRHLKRKWFFLGFFSGIGLLFSMLNGVVILSCILTGWILRRETPINSKLLACGIAGIATGFSPLCFYNVLHNFDTIRYFQSFFSENRVSSLMMFLMSWSLEIAHLVIGEIPASLSTFLQKPFWDYLFSSVYCTITLFFLFSLIQKILPQSLRDFGDDPEPLFRKKLIFFGIFPCFFLPIISYISLTMAWHGEMLPYRFRYFATFYLYLCLLGAILGTRAEKVSRMFLGFMVLMGVLGYIMLLKPENAGRLMRVPGYSIESVRQLWSTHSLPRASWTHKSWDELIKDENAFLKAIHDPFFWDNFEVKGAEDRIHQLKPRLKYYFLLNFASSAAADVNPSEINIPEWLNEDEKDIFYFGFAYALDWNALLQFPEQINAYYQMLPERARQWFLFVFGRYGFIWNPHLYEYELAAEDLSEIIHNTDAETEKWIFRGVGAAFLRHFPNLYPLEKDSIKILKTIPEAYRNDFWWGLGWNLRGRKGRYDLNWFESQIQNLPETSKSFMRQGFRAYQNQWYDNIPTIEG